MKNNANHNNTIKQYLETAATWPHPFANDCK